MKIYLYPTACSHILLIVFILFAAGTHCAAQDFDLLTAQSKVTIIYSTDHKLDSISASLLAKDIELVTGYKPGVTNKLKGVKGNAIVIGGYNSALIKSLKDTYFSRLKDKWECYSYKIINKPFKGLDQVLVIAGSDARGTAYGVFSLSEKIGVSPWYWWADVTPKRKETLTVGINEFTSEPPSIKFRGIFINDEDWGLQPWAAKTFEPETNDIGPKTYAKVFELLLRLKANLIWPAMHPGTKPFYSYPGNKQAAADYEIVVGSSHAEPMLRNNVGEWDEKTMGHFNYITNKPAVYNYWESRVKESSANNVIYTIGMRGVHDSGIEGVKTTEEAIPLLHTIIEDQRGLMQKYINKDAAKVPQVLTPYKEVLEIYEAGLKVPTDITLVWPDDNYGYIQRLSNNAENEREGGSGVYYHGSYWGRPHDYLWLSTLHPALLREEMTKAYTMNAKNLWVINIGDIKPAEYTLHLFADMAYNTTPFLESSYTATHLKNWVGTIFGNDKADTISTMLWEYYDLAFERKPEYMGWSQTEPTTKTKLTAYNHFYFGDQAQKRIDAYNNLENQANLTAKSIVAELKNAYYELVQYPVIGSSLINKKILYHDKAIVYAGQGRVSASEYKKLSEDAYFQTEQRTHYYNNELAGGKWKDMMSMKPRKLPVFDAPEFNLAIAATKEHWQAVAEGYQDSESKATMALPEFDRYNKQKYFIDVFLSKEAAATLSVIPSANWIRVSSESVTLKPQGLESQQRLWVEVDWDKVPQQFTQGKIVIKDNKQNVTIAVSVNNSTLTGLSNYSGRIAANDYIAINAADYTTIKSANNTEWKVIDKLGYSGSALEAFPLKAASALNGNDTVAIQKQAFVTYEFATLKDATAAFTIYTLPTHPLNKEFQMRYAIRIDNEPIEILNFKTAGRSEEWKENVLSNSAQRTIKNKKLTAGKHTLTIYQIDPGVVLDRIYINLNTTQQHYGRIDK
jgi:hypothetical protein